jgi:hypothetical protein
MGKHGPMQSGGFMVGKRNIMRSKDGTRDSHFAKVYKFAKGVAEKTGTDKIIKEAALGALEKAGGQTVGNVARAVIDQATGRLNGGAFAHRAPMHGRGARKLSKSGKEYPANVGSNAQVWHGSKEKTPGGLTKNDLMKTDKGRIVSKKKHAAGLKQFNKPGVREAFQARMFKKAS